MLRGYKNIFQFIHTRTRRHIYINKITLFGLSAVIALRLKRSECPAYMAALSALNALNILNALNTLHRLRFHSYFVQLSCEII